MSKYEMVGFGINNIVEPFASVLKCKSAMFPIKQVPLVAKHKDSKSWEPIIDIFDKCLAGWKRNYLSKGGRLTLIKNTLSNLPTYYRSVLTIPTKVAKILESIQCRFLWEDEENKKKFHLINWEEVKTPISSGGFGLRFLKTLIKPCMVNRCGDIGMNQTVRGKKFLTANGT